MKTFLTFLSFLFISSLWSQTFENSIEIYFNEDGGTQHSIAAADFDNDGLKDVLMASSKPNVFWVKNLGNNEFGPKITLFDDEIFGNSAKPIDLNNDGNIDIVAICSFANIVIAITGNGDGTFEEAVTIEQGLEPLHDLKIFDIDRDGFNDICYSTYDAVDDIGRVYWNKSNGDGSFGSRLIIAPNAFQANNLEFADLDGDQIPDLISKSRFDDKYTWFKNLGGGEFSSENEVRPPSPFPGTIAGFASDMDNDGDVDLLTYEGEDIAIYFNDGNGIFTASMIETSSWGWGITAWDFDADGDKDIFCGSGILDQAILLEGNGDGTFKDEKVLASDIGQLIDLWVEDMDDDGNPEILTASSLYDGYLLFLNEHNGLPSSVDRLSDRVEVKIFPNPAAQQISIQTKENVLSVIEVYDMLGNVVLTKKVDNSNEVELSLKQLIRGNYSIITRDKNGKQLSVDKLLKH